MENDLNSLIISRFSIWDQENLSLLTTYSVKEILQGIGESPHLLSVNEEIILRGKKYIITDVAFQVHDIVVQPSYPSNFHVIIRVKDA